MYRRTVLSGATETINSAFCLAEGNEYQGPGRQTGRSSGRPRHHPPRHARHADGRNVARIIGGQRAGRRGGAAPRRVRRGGGRAGGGVLARADGSGLAFYRAERGGACAIVLRELASARDRLLEALGEDLGAPARVEPRISSIRFGPIPKLTAAPPAIRGLGTFPVRAYATIEAAS